MGTRFSAVQTGPGTHPASCTMGTGSFPGVEKGRGVTLTPNPLLVPWSLKGRAIPLLSLRAFVAYKKDEICLLCMFRQAYCPSSGVLILYSQQLVFVMLVALTRCYQLIHNMSKCQTLSQILAFVYCKIPLTYLLTYSMEQSPS